MIATAMGRLASLLLVLGATVVLATPAGATPAGATPADTTRDAGRRPAAPTVGVLPFDVGARDTVLAALAYALPDLLNTDLARSAQLRVLERLRLGALLRELELSRRGLVDSASAPQIGRLLSARYLVHGAVRRAGPRTLVFDTRVADVESSQRAAGLSASASIDDILAAEKELAFRLLDQLHVTLTPRERASIAERPTGHLGALLAYGQGVRAEVEGQYAAAARAFARAATLDPRFAGAAARLREVRALMPDAARRGAVDRVNRPLTGVPGMLLPGLAVDPSLGGARATLVITINHD